MSHTIGRQTASYRQGLVLGLTMAEIMVLLVFCMLIAVGVVLASEHAKLDEAMQRLKETEATAGADDAILAPIRRNRRLAELVERARASGSPHDIDEFWRKLVESNDVVSDLAKQGVPVDALRDETASIAGMQRLLGQRVDPDKVARGMAMASAIDEAAPAGAPRKLTPQQVVDLIEKALRASVQDGEADHSKPNPWPPIINLSEADGYYFAAGSADLTADFATALRTLVISRLLQIAASYDVNVIEVIGHTDEQPVTNRSSNLDRSLAAVTSGASGTSVLQWADNAGLGLARALAVVKVLGADPRLATFRILPLSGAQLIDTDGRLTRWDGEGDVRERRRIEIRMRKAT